MRYGRTTEAQSEAKPFSKKMQSIFFDTQERGRLLKRRPRLYASYPFLRELAGNHDAKGAPRSMETNSPFSKFTWKGRVSVPPPEVLTETVDRTVTRSSSMV